jgi:hypothetical protein
MAKAIACAEADNLPPKNCGECDCRCSQDADPTLMVYGGIQYYCTFGAWKEIFNENLEREIPEWCPRKE